MPAPASVAAWWSGRLDPRQGPNPRWLSSRVPDTIAVQLYSSDMGLQPAKIAAPAMIDLIDADGLRRDLTALARDCESGALRKEGLGLIKAAFLKGRETVKAATLE